MQYVTFRNKYRPADNSLDWWTQFVGDYFSPDAVMKLSFQGIPQHPLQAPGSYPPQPPAEVPFRLLPRLFELKYGSGLKTEFICLSAFNEYPMPNGNMLLVCPGAMEFSIHDGYCVSKLGCLRVEFTPELKMARY
jgi:hypothetical protein